MYETNEYVTVQQGGVHRRPSQRIWLALIPTVAALVALLLVLGAACRSRSADEDASLGAVTATPSPSVEASPSPDPSEPAEEPGPQTGSGGSGSGGSGSGGSGSGGGAAEPDQPAEPDEPAPAEPLNIQASLGAVVPGGQCFASGTIEVSGGDYPVTVHYQWRRTALVDGELTYKPVSPVHNVTFDAPGSRTVQVSDIPPDGENIWFAVTGPETLKSDWATYDTCGGGPDIESA